MGREGEREREREERVKGAMRDTVNGSSQIWYHKRQNFRRKAWKSILSGMLF